MDNTINMVVRRECIERVGKFTEDPRLIAVEDFHFILRLAAHYQVKYIPEVALYRIHETKLCKQISMQRHTIS